MSFKTNECQQISIADSFMNLTARERKALGNSWAQIFSDEIFPAIEEAFFILKNVSSFFIAIKHPDPTLLSM